MQVLEHIHEYCEKSFKRQRISIYKSLLLVFVTKRENKLVIIIGQNIKIVQTTVIMCICFIYQHNAT